MRIKRDFETVTDCSQNTTIYIWRSGMQYVDLNYCTDCVMGVFYTILNWVCSIMSIIYHNVKTSIS